MRNKILLTFTIIVSIILLQACKKDKEINDTATEKDNVVQNSSFDPMAIKDMDTYLLNFMKEMKSMSRSSSSLAVEDAEWHLSACLNFQFCNANASKTHVIYDTIYNTISITDNDISLNDLNVVFEEITEEICLMYNSYDAENKNILFIKPEIQYNDKRGESAIVTIVAISSGNNNYYFDGNLLPDSLFYYDSYNWEDAADTLEYYIYKFKPEKIDIPGRVYYTVLREQLLYYNSPECNLNGHSHDDCVEHISRLYYCRSCTSNATIAKECMAFYLDSYLGLIEENLVPYTFISCEIEALMGNVNVHGGTLAPLPLHHSLKIYSGMEQYSVNPPITDNL